MFQNTEDHPLQLFKLLVILFCTCEIYCKPRSTLCAPTARSWLSQGHMLSQQLPTLQCLKFTQQTKIYIPRQQNDDILYIQKQIFNKMHLISLFNYSKIISFCNHPGDISELPHSCEFAMTVLCQ